MNIITNCNQPRIPHTFILLILLLSGCTHVPEDEQFASVAQEVQERSGMKAVWRVGHTPHPQITAEIQELLNRPLTEVSAVQIALLNNAGLQAKYTALGIAQADLVQAGLLVNPSVGALISFPEHGGSTNLTFDLAFNFLHLLTMPLRKAVAESEFEEARLQMVKHTFDLASQARMAYYQAIAAVKLKEYSNQLLAAASAHYETVKAMREAGNISELELMLAQSLHQQSLIEVSTAESEAEQAKLELALILGVRQEETPFLLSKNLPFPLEIEPVIIKETVLEKNLDLALIKQRLESSGRKYRVTNIKALVPDLTIGGETERDEGHWKTGPKFDFTLPIFDQGQPARAKAEFEIRGLQEEYAATVLTLETTLKAVQEKMRKTRHQLDHMQKILPLHQKVMKETLLHYNAMNKGITDLIRAKQSQIQAQRQHTEILLEYWLLRSSLEQMMHGSLPGMPQSTAMRKQDSTIISKETHG